MAALVHPYEPEAGQGDGLASLLTGQPSLDNCGLKMPGRVDIAALPLLDQAQVGQRPD
jgi:hypothetical protein